MNLFLNGEAFTLEKPINVAQLLEQLQLGNKRIAVEYNLDILSKGEHANTLLKENDRVEIVHAIGGG